MTTSSPMSHLRTLTAHAVEPLQTETALHGFLTGCVLTPEEMPFVDCLEAAFGIPRPEDLSEAARDALEGALDRIRATLQAGNFRFEPPLSVPEGERWCEGYVAGIRVAEDAWSPWHEANLEAAKAFLVIQAVAEPDLRELFIPPGGGSEGALTVEEMVELIVPAVRKIAIFRFAAPEVWDYLVDEDAFYELWSDADLAEMSDDELVGKLTELEDRVPRILIDECIRRAERLVPRLHALLSDDEMWRPRPDDGPDAWWALLHSMFILGALRGEAAGKALASGLARLRTSPDDFLWEWIGSEWVQLCAGKEEFVRPVFFEVARDPSVDPFGRSLAMEWLADSYATDEGGALEELLDWVASRITEPSEDVMVAEIAGMVLLDHPRERFRKLLMEQATSYAAEQRAFGIPYWVADVEHSFNEPRPSSLRPSHFLSFYDPNAIRERQLRGKREQGGFEDEDFGDEDLGEENFGSGLDDLAWLDELPTSSDMPYVRDQPKAQRPLPLRQWQEVQEMLPAEAVIRLAACRPRAEPVPLFPVV